MRQHQNAQETFQQFLEDQEPLVRGRVTIILLIGVTLVPFFGWVDWLLYPGLFQRFMTYRLVTAAFCLLLYFINRNWNFGYKSFYLGVVGYYLTGFCITKMVLETNGYASPYYAGMNLVFLTFCTVLNIRIRYLVVHCILLYLIFIISVLVSSDNRYSNLFLGHNMFVISTIAIILIASFVNHGLRLNEFLLRKELKEVYAKLKHYSSQLENTVAESQEKYRLVVENATEAILVVQDEFFRFANPKALEVFGLTQDELFSWPYVDLIHPDDRLDVTERLAKLLGGALPPDTYSFRIIAKDGSIKWLEIRMALVTWEDRPAALNLLNDITERKRAEEALKEAHRELERRVKERTAALEAAQEELVRKERFAMLGNLIAVVSHELRNPLGTIRASHFAVAERVRDKGLGVEQSLERAERNIVRCDKIIEELLDYARGHELDLEPTVMDQWLTEVLNEQTIPAEIRFSHQLASHTEMNVDRERFRRCLLNVLSNACQAMLEKHENMDSEETRSGKHHLRVESRVVGGRFELRVADTGSGMHADELEKVFQPLYSTKGFGVGLGLAIVKRIMELHRGGVDIESQPGEGTVVTLWLPTSSQ
jgi:PAS domain S-box-containing protein